MYISWQDAEIFLAVAEAGSFSAAARALDVTQPTVSRRIAALEADLGRPLFRRDSGGAHLTSEGERMLEPARQMSRWSAEMQRVASGWEDTASGPVRVAIPPGQAFELLLPLAERLRQSHPDLRVEALCGIEHIDLTRGDADLAVRTQLPTQPELVVLGSIVVELGVFAAAELAAELRRGTAGPIDATRIPWVTWSYPLEHALPRPQLEEALDPFVIGFASNDYLVQRRAVELGLGAMILPRIASDFDPWGELVELETTLPLPPTAAIHVVCARSMRHVPRVRVVSERLLELAGNVRGIRLRPGEA